MTARPARTILFVALAYTALTIAYAWPLPIRLSTGIAHDPYDPLLNTWILWWTTRALPLTAAWWNAPIYYPAIGVLAFSEHLLGLAPIAAPIIAVTGNPLVAYNVTLLASYVFSGLGAYFLAYTLTGRHDAAFAAGIAFAFAPYRLGQVPHIQVLCAYWTPVCLAALHRYGREPGRRWAVIAAAAWLMQALTNGYYMFFLSVLVAAWLLWFAVGRWPLRKLAGAVAAFVVAALLMLPTLLRYQAILRDTYGFSRSLEEIRMFSADAASLLLAPEDLLLWGWVHVVQLPESSFFPGLTIVLLAAFAIYDSRPFRTTAPESRRRRRVRLTLAILFALLLVATAVPLAYGTWRLTIGGIRLLSIARADKPLTLALLAGLALMASFPAVRAAVGRRSPLAFYLLAACAMWVFALGPDPTVMTHRALYQAPYGQLMRLPGFDGLRVPARFWMMTLACLSVVAALSINRVPGRHRRMMTAVAVIGLLLDGWPRRFLVVAAPELRPSPPGVVTRLDLPLSDDADTQALYRQMFDPVPLYNGYSGYYAPHYYALRTLLEERNADVLHLLAAAGTVGIVVDHAGDPDGSLRRFVMAYPGASNVRSGPAWSSYRLPADPSPPIPVDRTGPPLRIKSLATFPSPPHAARALDGDLRTRWSGGPQQQSAEATIELEAAAHVGQVVIDHGQFYADFSRRLQVEVSADGMTWQHVWTGDTALQAYIGAVRHPKEVPVVLPIDRDGVRFIRLRQVGFGPRDWSIAELYVLQ